LQAGRGVGYDPLFVPAGYGQTMAELGPKTKNDINHRAKAAAELVPFLQHLGRSTSDPQAAPLRLSLGRSLSTRLGLIVICLAMAATLLSAERATSPTVDEPFHLVRGLAWWWADDTRLNYPHPPLGQLVAAAPVALWNERVPIEKIRGYERADLRSTTMRYLNNYELTRSHLTAARRTMIVLALLLAVYLYEWIRRRYGPRLALMTTLLYAASPVLMAHAGLMTTDFPVALATIVAILQLHDYLLRRSWWRLLGLALAVGALVTAKLSGILISLLLVPPAVVFAAAGRGRFAGLRPRRRALILGRDMALAMMMALFTINAVYQFDHTGLTVAEIVEYGPSNKLTPKIGERGFVARVLPDRVPIPLPFTYLYAIDALRRHNERGHSSYLLGKEVRRGTPGYFPLMLAIKLPTGVLILMLAGLGLALRRRLRGLPLDVWLNAYFVSAYLILTLNFQINIGVRHAVLIVPSLIMLAARAANALWSSGRAGQLVASGCIVSVILGALIAHPRYIGDFNWLVGGRRGGHRVSAVGEDWGQDLNELADWQKRENAPLSYYHWFKVPRLELEYLGADFEVLNCGKKAPPGHWVAVHLSDWVRENRCVKQYVKREPDLVLNDHILLFSPE
jgi:hypothetical protein